MQSGSLECKGRGKDRGVMLMYVGGLKHLVPRRLQSHAEMEGTDGAPLCMQSVGFECKGRGEQGV